MRGKRYKRSRPVRKYVDAPKEEARSENRGRQLNAADPGQSPISVTAMGGGSAAPEAPCGTFVSLFWMEIASGSTIGVDAQQS